MADPRLERIRQLMREEEEKKNGQGRTSSSGDNASYPIFKIPEGATSLIRFLPDKDDKNAWFWVDLQRIKLPFDGTINGDSGPTDKPVIVTVPCVDMFGQKCPIIAETKPWWKDKTKPEYELARRYYKRVSFITQGFIVNSAFEEENAPENPIRRVVIGKKLVEKLKAGMADAEMEYLPTDYSNGTDFKLRKTKAGEYNDYSTSEYSRRSRPLNEAEIVALDQFGLFNLSDFRGTCPEPDGVAAIKAMFHASLRGDPYDYAEFSNYYRPYGAGASSFSGGATSDEEETVDFRTAPASSKTVVEDAAPVAVAEKTVATATSGSKLQPQDLLAKLREKTQSRT